MQSLKIQNLNIGYSNLQATLTEPEKYPLTVCIHSQKILRHELDRTK
jgi:hypothetical protein